jgi:hypothetical protein
MGNCEYVVQYYGVPACIGRGVIVDGKPGVIVEDRGHYIGVNFDHDKPGNSLPCHPTWEVVYGEMRPVRKMTRSQQRYRDFLRADLPCTFFEYLKWDAQRRRNELQARY